MTKISDCRQEDDWALYAFGALDPEDEARMRAHLETQCDICLQNYQDALAVMDDLALSVPQLDPSPDVAGKLLARISPPAPAKVVAIRKPGRPSLPSTSWLAAAACALLACGLGLQLYRTSLLLRQEQALHASATGSPAATAPPSVIPAASTLQPSQQRPSPPAAPGHETEALKAEVRELTSQLTALQAQQQLAAARATQAANDLALARQQQDQLRAQLAGTEDRLRAAAAPHPEDAQVDVLKKEMEAANSQIAELKYQAKRSNQILTFLDGGSLQQAELRGIDPAADNARAVAFYSQGRGLLILAHKLPQLKQNKCYQLWSIHKAGQAITSVGLLQLDAQGEGYLYTSSTQNLEHLSALAITDEPQGGSISAQGRKLLFGSFN